MLCLMERIGYRFSDEGLLRLALTHPSSAQPGGESNQRLEFLGDAVLQLCASHCLYLRHPQMHEGDAHAAARGLGAGKLPAPGALAWQLGGLLRLGPGEESSGGRDKPSILADAVEAVLGAVYLDGGLGEAQRIVSAHISPNPRPAGPGITRPSCRSAPRKTEVRPRATRSSARKALPTSASSPPGSACWAKPSGRDRIAAKRPPSRPPPRTPYPNKAKQRNSELRLKRLEIYGFKSFAERTRMEFVGGITGVVGPNGSGKSNISDAVRWVLGEQSAKTLRGARMEDVIFGGTQTRKPLNFCEVTLVFDNEDKALPVDFAEVQVTRRVYRSGESEYLLNKAACRLKGYRRPVPGTAAARTVTPSSVKATSTTSSPSRARTRAPSSRRRRASASSRPPPGSRAAHGKHHAEPGTGAGHTFRRSAPSCPPWKPRPRRPQLHPPHGRGPGFWRPTPSFAATTP